MDKCKITTPLIEENVYGLALAADLDVVIIDGIMYFSSNERLHNFINMANETFKVDGIEDVIDINEEENTAVVAKTEEFIDLVEFAEPKQEIENPAMSLYSISSVAPEYVMNDEAYKRYFSYLSKIEDEIERISNTLKNLRRDYADEKLTSKQRLKIQQEIDQYRQVRKYLYDQVDRIRVDMPKVITKMENARDMLNYIVRNFDVMTSPNLIHTVNNIIEEVALFMKDLGDKKYSTGNKVTATTEDRIKSIRSEIDALKLAFERKLSAQQNEFLAGNPILLNDTKIKDILNHPESEEYKQFFGGAAIGDIGFLEYLGLNVDTASTFDGVLGQLLYNHADMIGQNENNAAIREKKIMKSFADRYLKHGINLELKEDTDFFFEKDKFGHRTGNLVRPTTYEFSKKLSDFFELYAKQRTNKDRAELRRMLKEEFDVINLFNLDIFHLTSKENDVVKEFNKVCRLIYEEITGNPYHYRDEVLGKTSYQSAYQNSLIEKFGEDTFNSIVNEMMVSVIDYYYSNKGNIKATGYGNPLIIMKMISDIKDGKKPELFYGSGKNRKRYRFYTVPFIPHNDSDYNTEFQKQFIQRSDDLGNLNKEYYKFLSEMLKDMNLLYTGKESLRMFDIDENVIDQMSDAVKGIARLSDAGKSLRDLKKSTLEWLGDKFWSEHYVSKDDSKVALNYSSKAEKVYKNVVETFRKAANDTEVNKLAKKYGIEKSNYSDIDEYYQTVARAVSLEKTNGNMFVTMMKSIDLYHAQKARNEIYPVAKMIQRQYMSYTNYSGNARSNANKRMQDWITRSIQKLNLEEGESVADKKLSNITILQNMISRFDEMPIVKKIINKKLLKKMSDDEKMLYDTLEEAKKNINSLKDTKFEFEGYEYQRETKNGVTKYYKIIKKHRKPITEAEFKNTISKYYDKRMSNLGADATIQNLINLIRNLLLYKMLAGVSTSGIFNRIEGHLANSEMDATGYYWTPGNLNYVEKYFFGAWLSRYINKQGGKLLIKNEDKKWWKRLDIIRKISDQTNIFQDMKNQFDKTIEGEQKGVLRHNFDPFQLSVSNPEFKNQMSAVLAVLIDKRIMDKNDVEHPIFDKKTGEFTCFDIKDGELILKDEFQRKDGLNDSWVTFQSTVDKDGKKVISSSFEFAQQCKIMIKNIHGDYRQNAALGYNNNLILSHLMMLKRWLPQKVLRGWSEGGSVNKETGDYMANYDIMWHKNEQSGIWFDTLTKAKSPLTALMPIILSTTKLHKGILQTAAGTTASLFMIGKIIKDKLGARNGEIENNIGMLEETLEMGKALFWEILAAPGRALKMDINLSGKSFANVKYKNAYGEITLGNFRACARTIATYFYLVALGVLVKLLFWDPEDGDDDARRKMFNWIDNNLENILESTTATMYMIDNFEDKSEVSNIPVIRWTNDLGKFIEACNEMNGDKAKRYAYKVFAPIRFPLPSDNFNPFENQFEYQKDTWDDRLIKNIKTEGEWGAEQNYKHIRADIKRQYVEMWEDKKLPDKVAKEIERMGSFKKLGYSNVYELPSDVFKDLVSKSSVIPSRKQKQYKEKDYKFMQDVLMDEYENNEFLQNHTLKYIFGGYDNRISAYWQRNASSEYNIVRDNPYIDDGD